MVRIHIFQTGSVIVDQAIPYRERNPLAVTGFLRKEENRLELPVSCYLIEHPKGRILIDTGWDSKYITQRARRFFGLLDKISTPVIRPGQSVDCKLKNIGLTASDIDCVFFSHMDFDHTSGLRLVKDAKRIMAAKEEIVDSKKYFYRYVSSNWNFANVEAFEYQVTGIGPVKKSYDVFGDSSVVLINTPGHTHGLFSVRISKGESYIILAGDTIYTRKSIREKIIPGFTVDAELARQSLEWICQCAADRHCLLVAANHDPEIKEQIIEL